MKLIVSLMIVALAMAAPTTLITDATATASVEISSNSANSSNVDLVFNLDYPDTFATLTDDTVNAVICFDSTNSNYTIANSASNLNAFGLRWTCTTGSGACSSIGAVNNAFLASKSAIGATTGAGAFNTGAMTAMTGTFTGSTNTTTNVAIQTATGLTPTEMVGNSLPNTTQTAYLRCFAKFDAATATDLATGISDVAATYTATKNVTLKGASYGVTAVLAVAGSAIAALVF